MASRLLRLILIFACCTPALAQVQPEISAQEYADRARRLREFGYPEHAKEQIAIAARRYPTEKPVVLEHLRLLTATRAPESEVAPWIRIAQKLYANDFDCAFALAHWVYLNEREPAPPGAGQIDAGAKRLSAEMDVFVALARYITKPDGDLPAQAGGTPMLPLAYLARCAKEKPGDTAVEEFAARYLDLLGCRFQNWSGLGPQLAFFNPAAQDLFTLCVPLYQRVEEDERFTSYARQRMTEILFRMGRFQDAHKQAIAAELIAPNSRKVAQVLQAIAEQTDDYDLLVDSQSRLAVTYRDETTRLDVLAAMRVRDEKWPMIVWRAWLALRELNGKDRASAAHALLQDKPGFLEVHFIDASQRVEVALGDDPPADPVPILESALRVLELCKTLGDKLADWHGLRATVLWKLGRFEEAALAFDSLAKLDQTDKAAPRFARAARDIVAGKFTAADWEVYRTQVDTEGDFREKLDALKEITSRAPKFFEAQMMLSEVALMLEQFETSQKAANAAIEIVPDNLECLENAAWSAMHLGSYERAAQAFQRMNELSPGYRDAGRWHSLTDWAAKAKPDEQSAFLLWLTSSKGSLQAAQRRQMIERAVELAPTFPEPLLDLAQMEQIRGETGSALSLLERALKHARDNWVRAEIHRARGRIFSAERNTQRAVSEFEQAYAANRGDGGDLLLAALALHGAGENGGASAAMRKLFTEMPGTLLLRPMPSEVHLLDLIPAQGDGVKSLSPAYGAGDRLTFRVEIAVSGEGKGQVAREVTTEFEMLVHVLETPAHGGVWKLEIGFANPPAPEWQALTEIKTTLRISPWFGLCDEPQISKYSEVVGPAIQALTEGLTAGLGDAPIKAPFVWKNALTKGPPHFGLGTAEGSCLHAVTGDSFTITRRALAGRRLNDVNSGESTYGRGLEAKVEAGGLRNALRRVSFEIGKEELSPERDDVIRSTLRVSITAK